MTLMAFISKAFILLGQRIINYSVFTPKGWVIDFERTESSLRISPLFAKNRLRDLAMTCEFVYRVAKRIIIMLWWCLKKAVTLEIPWDSNNSSIGTQLETLNITKKFSWVRAPNPLGSISDFTKKNLLMGALSTPTIKNWNPFSRKFFSFSQISSS